MGKRSSRKQKPSHKNHNSRPKNGQSQLARSFQPGGSDIFSCEPYVYTVSPQDAHLRCHCCLKLLPDAELRPTEFSCGSCKYFRYCGKECQNKDKLRHQNECALWKRIKDAGLVPNVTFILVLRAVLAMKDAGQENDWELLKFSDLLSHVEVLLKDEEEKALVTSTRKSLAKILKMTEKNLLDPDSFPELYGRIRFNAMAIYDTDVIQSLKGHGIYKHFAYLKHSCMPSACAIFEGVRLKVRAMKYVPDISKVTVSFVDQLLPRSCRCKILMEEYDCVCDCQRCSTPGTDAEMYALRCPRKNCSAVIPSDHRALTECVACGARLYDNSAYSSALILMAEFPLLKSQLAKRIGSVTGPENSYRVLCELNTAMEKYDVLHYNNPYFSALMLFMGNVYFKRHEYSQAAVWVEFALESYRFLLLVYQT
ncbi:histone-lysine N-methyltransferase SMYD3-like isoform X2 [Paramacrobiotus metropolitanus]|uniref:histone-lysine N-methyltransferase SMYD3-like isoform X2 n=1 Tax=Paramacrobiotus metropolitanus TaxID=2943436 RepID=UPI002445D1D3|nr:histone-lysine N-methyltransferase SMYD3-like isoform X2 [Paramacrobiotus metropolitanus]